jgi:putative redox protein
MWHCIKTKSCGIWQKGSEEDERRSIMLAQLEVTVTSTNRKLGYTGALRSHPAVPIDYIPPLGDGMGYTPLELLLMSLAACSGGTVGLLLRKTGKTVTGIKVNTKGVRREQHPMSFQKIFLEFVITSDDVKDVDVQKAIKLAEDSVCPVWAMVKGNAEISSNHKIVAS